MLSAADVAELLKEFSYVRSVARRHLSTGAGMLLAHSWHADAFGAMVLASRSHKRNELLFAES